MRRHDDTGAVFEDRGWKLVWNRYDRSREKLRETLSTTANGRFGTRGAFCGQDAEHDVHYPGTYIAGLYDAAVTRLHGRDIRNNDLVNCPNWLVLKVKIGDGPVLRLDEAELVSYRHELEMRRAVTVRSFRYRDHQGRITLIRTEQFASMADPCAAALRYTIEPENWSGTVRVHSALDGTVVNDGVPRYRKLRKDHLEPLAEGREGALLYLDVMTKHSGRRISMKARTEPYDGAGKILAERTTVRKPMYAAEEFRLELERGRRYTIEKIVQIVSSVDAQALGAGPLDNGTEARFGPLEEAHAQAWERLWSLGGIEVEGDEFSSGALRFHAYHLLSTASPLQFPKLDAGIPARGLSGEAYRGHIFWDSLVFLPYFMVRFPETAKAMLMYRYRRLDDARAYAREHGYEGAMFPWQTADDGREETQVIHYNPISGSWDPDLSSLQRHVSLAVAYNIWEYFHLTFDREFLHGYGIEMMIEIARFWTSAAVRDRETGRYHIDGVMGPDEFHEKYPGRETGGFRDNAYTNILTAWIVHKTIESVEYLPEEVLRELTRRIHFTPDEPEHWKEIVSALSVPIRSDGVIEQFEGYSELADLDLEAYRERYGQIARMDRILKAEGDSPDRYRVAKQADTLMLFYLLSPGQVAHTLTLMGYDPGDPIELMRKNFEFYLPRTTHGSTLSYIAFSGMLKYLPGREEDQWSWYLTALESDLEDLQGGTTAEAIHCGVMGGTLDLAVKSFAGLAVYRDRLVFEPCLPRHWERLAFTIRHRGSLFRFEIRHGSLTAELLEQGEFGIRVEVMGNRLELDSRVRRGTAEWNIDRPIPEPEIT